MKQVLKVGGVASSILMAGALTASAAVIDFTAGLPGATSGPGWTATATDKFGNVVSPIANATGPGATTIDTYLDGADSASLAGDNDGFGVVDDEVGVPGNTTRFVPESITITFDKPVKLLSAYYLDLFTANDGSSLEFVTLDVDGVDSGLGDFAAVVPFSEGVGLGEQVGIKLVGTSFTFNPGATNDNIGRPDFALAGLEIGAVPLPAGFLLLGTALGGLGLARRRKKA